MKPPLHIGYVVKRFPRISETFIAQEILELERQGAKITVFALGDTDEPADHRWLARLRAEVIRVPHSFGDAWADLAARYASPGRRKGVISALLTALADPLGKGHRCLSQAVTIAAEARSRGVDHLHAHFANQPATTALLAHQLSGLPFSFTAHAKDIWTNPATPAHWRRLITSAAFVVTVSDATRDYLRREAGDQLAGRILRLYNGVDLDAIRPDVARTSTSGQLNLVCVARFVEKKGLDVLLDACALLTAKGIRLRVKLIGDGLLGAQLRAQAAALGLREIVDFTGALGHERVIETMRCGDAFVLPCRVAADGDRDALPTVLLEAMACGLPCVSTPIAGVSEIIADGSTGLLVPVGEAAPLAAALSRIAADPDIRRRMGRAGRARAERLFDLHKNVAELHGWCVPSREAARAWQRADVQRVSG